MIAATAVLALALGGAAKPELNVDCELGWQGCWRPTDWLPIEVRIQSPAKIPIEAVVSVSARQDELTTCTVRHRVVLTPDVMLAVPLVAKIDFSAPDLSLEIRDGKIEAVKSVISINKALEAMVQLVELALQKLSPGLYRSLGIYLPLITTNCAVLGVCFININEEYGFIQTLVSSFAYPAGFGLALILFAGVRERILLARVPKPLQETSIGLVTAGMMSLAFYAFKGMA